MFFRDAIIGRKHGHVVGQGWGKGKWVYYNLILPQSEMAMIPSTVCCLVSSEITATLAALMNGVLNSATEPNEITNHHRRQNHPVMEMTSS